LPGTTGHRKTCLLIPRIEIFARFDRLSHAFGPRAMRRPAPAPRKAIALGTGFISARAAIDLRLRSGDERRQAIDPAGVCDHRLGLRLRLILRLRAVFAVALLFARRLLALIGLTVALIARAVVAHIGLRLYGHETGLLAKA